MGIFGRRGLNKQSIKGYYPPADVWPRCPHCEKTFQGVFTQEISNEFGKTWLYFCTNCSKVLGVSQRKGFFMG